jgi:hypothetical protein
MYKVIIKGPKGLVVDTLDVGTWRDFANEEFAHQRRLWPASHKVSMVDTVNEEILYDDRGIAKKGVDTVKGVW